MKFKHGTDLMVENNRDNDSTPSSRKNATVQQIFCKINFQCMFLYKNDFIKKCVTDPQREIMLVPNWLPFKALVYKCILPLNYFKLFHKCLLSL